MRNSVLCLPPLCIMMSISPGGIIVLRLVHHLAIRFVSVGVVKGSSDGQNCRPVLLYGLECSSCCQHFGFVSLGLG